MRDAAPHVLKRASEIPDEFEIVDETGNALPEYGHLRLSPEHKLMVARRSLRWHQSVQRTLERMIASAVREYTKTHMA